MARMNVLISGAGIAGGSLAFWLSKLGHDVTVVERFPNLRASGLQIDLRGHGIEVLKRMGLEQAFRAKSVPEQGLKVVDSSGRQRGYFPANKSGQGQQCFTTDYEIMRGDFCRLLYDATKDRVKYIFGTSIKSFEQRHGSVEVQFTNGTTDQFNLLVGADGQTSRTRKMMLASNNTADGFYPLPDGVHVAYFTIPRPIQEGEEYMATMYFGTEKRGVLIRRHNSKEIQVYVGFTTESPRLTRVPQHGIVQEEKQALTEIYQGAGWQTEEIVHSLKDTSNFYVERIGLVKLDSWSEGRVTLVGDAAHCPSVNTGMGTTSGIVGAYILAGEIGQHYRGRVDGEDDDGIEYALKSYERKFRPFMTQVQKGVLEETHWRIWSTTFGIGIINLLAGLLSFFQVNVGKWMLKESVKDWDLPDYEEIVRPKE